MIWRRMSERYAQGATGNVYGFVNGSNIRSIFNTVEYPTLLKNENITNVFTEIFKQREIIDVSSEYKTFLYDRVY